MGKNGQRGEIATLLTIAAMVAVGAGVFISSLITNQNKNTTSTRASEPTCSQFPPIGAPSGYYWEGDCNNTSEDFDSINNGVGYLVPNAPNGSSNSCANTSGISDNTLCKQNNRQGEVNPANSNYCYGFSGPLSPGYKNFRCMTLKFGTPSQASPTPAPPNGSCNDAVEEVYYDRTNGSADCYVQSAQQTNQSNGFGCYVHSTINENGPGCQYIATQRDPSNGKYYYRFDCSNVGGTNPNKIYAGMNYLQCVNNGTYQWDQARYWRHISDAYAPEPTMSHILSLFGINHQPTPAPTQGGGGGQQQPTAVPIEPPPQTTCTFGNLTINSGTQVCVNNQLNMCVSGTGSTRTCPDGCLQDGTDCKQSGGGQGPANPTCTTSTSGYQFLNNKCYYCAGNGTMAIGPTNGYPSSYCIDPVVDCRLNSIDCSSNTNKKICVPSGDSRYGGICSTTSNSQTLACPYDNFGCLTFSNGKSYYCSHGGQIVSNNDLCTPQPTPTPIPSDTRKCIISSPQCPDNTTCTGHVPGYTNMGYCIPNPTDTPVPPPPSPTTVPLLSSETNSFPAGTLAIQNVSTTSTRKIGLKAIIFTDTFENNISFPTSNGYPTLLLGQRDIISRDVKIACKNNIIRGSIIYQAKEKLDWDVDTSIGFDFSCDKYGIVAIN